MKKNLKKIGSTTDYSFFHLILNVQLVYNEEENKLRENITSITKFVNTCQCINTNMYKI